MPRQKRRQSPSKHRHYLREALAMVRHPPATNLILIFYFQARTALETGETPVGCVFVHSNKIIGRGMNETNKSRSVYIPPP
jgi:Cytidine and deoxycytidylate deaminase zinc-binding region